MKKNVFCSYHLITIKTSEYSQSKVFYQKMVFQFLMNSLFTDASIYCQAHQKVLFLEDNDVAHIYDE